MFKIERVWTWPPQWIRDEREGSLDINGHLHFQKYVPGAVKHLLGNIRLGILVLGNLAHLTIVPEDPCYVPDYIKSLQEP
jgi:hypothetical protein